MENRESSWRTQLSFLSSLFLHASAIAIIALGPTFLSSHGFYLGSKPANNSSPNNFSQPVDVTFAQSKPLRPPAVVYRPARVAQTIPAPIVAHKVVAHKKIVAQRIVSKTVVPKKFIRKDVAAQSKVVAQSAIQKSAIQKPVERTAAPLGSPTSSIKVTQNYLGLRQMPGNQPPVYTTQMRLQHMQGSGQLVYYVNKNGMVSDIHLTKSTGYPPLDQAAIQAFSKYRFYPGQEGYTVHNFEFVLQGPAVTYGGGLTSRLSRLTSSGAASSSVSGN